MEIHITHQGRTLASLEITPDANINVIASPSHGSAQYVWGASPAAHAPAMHPSAQYVWGSNPAAQHGAGQLSAQYVWGSNPTTQAHIGISGAQQPAAQYVWGATNERPLAPGGSTVIDSLQIARSTAAVPENSAKKMTDPLI